MSYSTCTITSSADLNTNEYSGFEYYMVDAAGGNISITLPEIAYTGQTFIINRFDTSTNIVSLVAYTGNTILDNASQNITQRNYSELCANESNWLCAHFNY